MPIRSKSTARSVLAGLRARSLESGRERATGKSIAVATNSSASWRVGKMRTLGPPKRSAFATRLLPALPVGNRVDPRGAWNWRAFPPSLGAVPPRCLAGRGTEDDQQIHDGL